MEQSQQYPQEVSALFYIRTTRSHPPIPEQLSAEAKDFLLKCFHKEPDLTPSASDLLLHPFIICEYHESHSISRGSVRDSCNWMSTDGTNSRNFFGFYPRINVYRPKGFTASVVDKQKELLVNKVVREKTNSIDEMRRILKSLNHYEALGFNRHKKIDATVLKKEYRKKAMLVHPDKIWAIPCQASHLRSFNVHTRFLLTL
ncbi:hypothetical protein KIW84_012852 [Lathyrus oleraceus]|uniref:J domain-containing protein n=1 Tax=Pisum sativum TaxID=3888 RepID=A0A9D5GXC1_PEA|nr:hypothetical protein KIW84_012852 [Pisum sativum]